MGAVQHLTDLGFLLRMEGGMLFVTPASQITEKDRDFIRQHKAEILAELAAHDGKPPAPNLDATRAAYFAHKDTCPTCSLSWAATASCEIHGELWLAYHDALVSVHGANLVDGLPELPPEPPASKDAPMGTNGYRTVPTAYIKPQSWIVTRDALHSHWFTCQRCKASGVCSEGAALREIYNQQNSLTEFST